MFLLDALTNMHVGSGETHYDIVDNKIQRNPVTNIPVIHSSGIKGAFREYCSGKKDINIDLLFGKEPKDTDDDKSSPGHLIIFEANLIFIPLRSTEKAFYYCTSPYALMDFFEYYSNFCKHKDEISLIEKWLDKQSFSDNVPFVTFDGRTPEIEDYSSLGKGVDGASVKKILAGLFKVNIEDIALFSDTFFTAICEDAIPVVTRNKIDDEGMSENLFYEEVLPRRSKLSFILGEENGKLGDNYNKFVSSITGSEASIQVGGNYSIGYGFSKITKL